MGLGNDCVLFDTGAKSIPGGKKKPNPMVIIIFIITIINIIINNNRIEIYIHFINIYNGNIFSKCDISNSSHAEWLAIVCLPSNGLPSHMAVSRRWTNASNGTQILFSFKVVSMLDH